MIKVIHPMAGALALLTIVTFWLSMPFSELFASDATVTAVKTGFLLLIPALAATGGSGPALEYVLFSAGPRTRCGCGEHHAIRPQHARRPQDERLAPPPN